MAKESKQSGKTVKLELGSGASSFYSPMSGVDLIPGQTAEVAEAWLSQDDSLKVALANGHVKRVGEDDDAEQKAAEEVDKKDKKGTGKEPNPSTGFAPPAEGEGSIKEKEASTHEEKETKAKGNKNKEAEEDEDPSEWTKTELIDAIKNSKNVPDDKKTGLTDLNKDQLVKRYNKYEGK